MGSGLITHNVIHILETQHECGYTLETWKVGFILETSNVVSIKKNLGDLNLLMWFFVGWCLMRGKFS